MKAVIILALLVVAATAHKEQKPQEPHFKPNVTGDVNAYPSTCQCTGTGCPGYLNLLEGYYWHLAAPCSPGTKAQVDINVVSATQNYDLNVYAMDTADFIAYNKHQTFTYYTQGTCTNCKCIKSNRPIGGLDNDVWVVLECLDAWKGLSCPTYYELTFFCNPGLADDQVSVAQRVPVAAEAIRGPIKLGLGQPKH